MCWSCDISPHPLLIQAAILSREDEIEAEFDKQVTQLVIVFLLVIIFYPLCCCRLELLSVPSHSLLLSTLRSSAVPSEWAGTVHCDHVMCSDQSDAVALRLLVAMHQLESTVRDHWRWVVGRVCMCVWTHRGILYGLNMTYAYHILPKVHEHKLADMPLVNAFVFAYEYDWKQMHYQLQHLMRNTVEWVIS